MFGLGFTEILVILVVALLVFGPDRLPELARNLGKGLAEFRRASSDLRRSVLEASDEPRVLKPPPPEARSEPARGFASGEANGVTTASAGPATPAESAAAPAAPPGERGAGV